LAFTVAKDDTPTITGHLVVPRLQVSDRSNERD